MEELRVFRPAWAWRIAAVNDMATTRPISPSAFTRGTAISKDA
jgi:hypothetical protein